jgi:hypothetical protein
LSFSRGVSFIGCRVGVTFVPGGTSVGCYRDAPRRARLKNRMGLATNRDKLNARSAYKDIQ